MRLCSRAMKWFSDRLLVSKTSRSVASPLQPSSRPSHQEGSWRPKELCSCHGFVEPQGAHVRLSESNHKEAQARYVAPFHPRIPAARCRPARPPSPARLPLGTRLALWRLAPLLRLEPIRAMARHIVERLTETPLTASTYSQRSLRVTNGRSSRSASRSFSTRSSILGRLPGALPGSRDFPLWALER